MTIKIKEIKSIYCVLLCLLLGFLYIFTMCPTVFGGDSGELTAASVSLGIAHPPGYPVYVLLGNLFSRLPVSNTAFRLNLMSVFFGITGLVVLFYLLALRNKNVHLSLLLCLNAGTGIYFWLESVKAEVYTLNVFFTIFCMFLLILWTNTSNQNFLLIFSLVLGLGAGNHHLLVLTSPAFLLYIILNRKSLKTNTVLQCIGLFIFGILTYLYLPFRSIHNPVVDWGNPENPGNFFRHVRRAQYEELVTGGVLTLKDKLLFFVHFVKNLWKELKPLIFFLAVAGIPLTIINKWKEGLMYLAYFVLGSCVLILLIPIPYTPAKAAAFDSYYLPVYFICFIYASRSIEYILKRINRKDKVCLLVTCAILTANLAWMVLGNFKTCNLRNVKCFYTINKYTLSKLPRNSVLFSEGDNLTFPVAYLKMVERYRPDIKVYDRMGNLFEDVYEFSQVDSRSLMTRQRNIELQIMKDRNFENIYFIEKPDYSSHLTSLAFVQEGLVYKLSFQNGFITYPDPSSTWTEDFDFRKEKYMTFEEKDIISRYYYLKGKDLLYRGMRENDPALIDAGMKFIDRAGNTGREIASMVNKVSQIYFSLNQVDKSLDLLLRAHKLDPLNKKLLYNMSLCHMRKDDYAAARKTLEKALAIQKG